MGKRTRTQASPPTPSEFPLLRVGGRAQELLSSGALPGPLAEDWIGSQATGTQASAPKWDASTIAVA